MEKAIRVRLFIENAAWLCILLAATVTFAGCGRQNAENSKSELPSANKGEPATKLEAFFAKKGEIIVRDIYQVGDFHDLGALSVEAAVLYEPGKETDRVRGLRMTVSEAGTLERSNISFLDMDEIDSLINGLDYMVTLSKKWVQIQREPYTEVEFSSKGDFQVGFYQRAKQQ